MLGPLQAKLAGAVVDRLLAPSLTILANPIMHTLSPSAGVVSDKLRAYWAYVVFTLGLLLLEWSFRYNTGLTRVDDHTITDAFFSNSTHVMHRESGVYDTLVLLQRRGFSAYCWWPYTILFGLLAVTGLSFNHQTPRRSLLLICVSYVLVGFCHFPFSLDERCRLAWWVQALQIVIPVISWIATEGHVSVNGTWFRLGVDLLYGWTIVGPYWNWPGQWQAVFMLAYAWRASLGWAIFCYTLNPGLDSINHVRAEIEK